MCYFFSEVILVSITIKEIAELAGVSTATVSRAFSKNDYVNAETRDRILSIAEENGFIPRKYKQKKGATLSYKVAAVVVPDINNAYYAEVIRGIEQVMNAQGIQVVVCNSDEDSGREIRILDTLNQIGVCGIIIASVSGSVEYNVEYLHKLNKNGTPVVLLDRDLRGGNMDGVFMDNYNGAYQSIQTFIDNGHRDIAFVCGPMTSTSSQDRFNAYVDALKANNIPVNEEYIVYGDFKLESAYRLTKKLMAKRNKITAIFSSNRRMSSGCLMALAERGMVPGKDIAFISCGKLDYSDLSISYVDYPTVDIGRECAKMLIEKANSGKRQVSTTKNRITFDMTLVLRGSEKLPQHQK